MMKRLVITICVSLLLVSAGLAIGERQVLIEHNKKVKDFKVPHIKWIDVTFRVDYRRIDSKKANISVSVHGPHEVVVKPYDIVIVTVRYIIHAKWDWWRPRTTYLSYHCFSRLGWASFKKDGELGRFSPTEKTRIIKFHRVLQIPGWFYTKILTHCEITVKDDAGNRAHRSFRVVYICSSQKQINQSDQFEGRIERINKPGKMFSMSRKVEVMDTIAKIIATMASRCL